MLIGFLDDTELVVDAEDSSPDVFAVGGYFLPLEALEDFQKSIVEVKNQFGFLPHTPVKWNLKDTGLMKFCSQERLLDPDIPQRLLAVSNDLRRDLLALLRRFDARILISARYDQHWREASHAEYYAWAFENLLQRVGLMCRQYPATRNPHGSSLLVMDWPQSGVDKNLLEVYLGGYHYGFGLATRQSYFSGRIADYRFLDSLVHGSTYHSGPLQVADLVVGCCRDFLGWAIKGTHFQKIHGLFDLVMDRFYVDERGRLNDCGFILAKGEPVDLEAKIKEYAERVNELDYEDIPI